MPEDPSGDVQDFSFGCGGFRRGGNVERTGRGEAEAGVCGRGERVPQEKRHEAFEVPWSSLLDKLEQSLPSPG